MNLEALLLIGGGAIVIGALLYLPFFFFFRWSDKRRLSREITRAKLALQQLAAELRISDSPELLETSAERVFPDIDNAIVKSVFARFKVGLSPAGSFSVQPEPEVIEQLARDVFGQEQADEAMKYLKQYGSKGYELTLSNPQRVRLDIIKLADGNVGSVPALVKEAKRDFRDISFKAETPNFYAYFMENGKATKGNVPLNFADPEFRRVADADLKQFGLWLIRHST
jgi:type II secretory pathway pseudopilin PulG